MLREAELPLELKTHLSQKRTQGLQCTNQVPIDDSREAAVPQGQDQDFVRSHSLFG